MADWQRHGYTGRSPASRVLLNPVAVVVPLALPTSHVFNPATDAAIARLCLVVWAEPSGQSFSRRTQLVSRSADPEDTEHEICKAKTTRPVECQYFGCTVAGAADSRGSSSPPH